MLVGPLGVERLFFEPFAVLAALVALVARAPPQAGQGQVGGAPPRAGRRGDALDGGEGVGEGRGGLDRRRGGGVGRPAHERGGDQARGGPGRRVVSGAGGDDVEGVADEPADRRAQGGALGQA
ncbi:MAG TPA: hypothetical protein VFS00_29600, partial [Polyangiaceae bacterium]|nr:hypothetical protein [Polyangiaceae bacterium]